ncbi:PKD domain-containing protein [Halorientalis brevis]|uniref:PKD domain-containing protein n=1 Tax=Halorientalis brevis TaxID=1126241 RepID=A0ABD6C6K0_9EURY|nr:PKD domain-containing protein [Halorientalis brevis]
MGRFGLALELRTLALTAVVVAAVTTAGVVPVPVRGIESSPTHGDVASPAADGIYAVSQNGTCYEVTALGDGSQTVSQFYDYSPNFSFSSAGTRRIQQNQESRLFVYDGANGDSLVILHDQYDESGGGAVSFTITGLPAAGTWAVEDDHYTGRDDNFAHRGSRSTIDWVWQDERTDGAAFRGLGAAGQSGITIKPSFNEEAALWGTWQPRSEGGRIDSWQLLSGGGWPVATLALDEPVTIRPGGCDRTPPTASISTNRSTIGVSQRVTLSAANATDDTGVVSYQWDVDGDGVTERNTTTPTITTTYERARTYTPRVTVTDAAGNADSTTTTVTVNEGSSLMIQRAAAGGLRTTLTHVPGSGCGFSHQRSLGECVTGAPG